MSKYVANYQDHVGIRTEKFYKTTVFQGKNLMIGLNCLEPGQIQPPHDHSDQDKFYYVIAGVGVFTVGEDVIEIGPGHIVWAQAGVEHGVENKGHERLAVLVGIAPPPK